MSLFTFNFLFFLFATVLVYYLLPHRMRWAVLLIASAGFYVSYSVMFAVVLALVIVVNYFLGLWMDRGSESRKKVYLVTGVLFNVCLLFFYKFAAPALATLSFFQQDSLHADSLLMPIGLSFHTLQAVSYLVEVNRGSHAAERHAGFFALSILFFPRVLSGPIEKPSLLDQFKAEVSFDSEQVKAGMKTLAWGFFKKMFIADRLAPLVNQVFIDPTSQSGATLSLTMLIYAVVLYTDFSGYSDIAVGAAQVFGIRLIQNFDHPYSARSVSEFWQRWHISLSNWLRDYIFFPLRRYIMRNPWANRIPLASTIFPPLITMLASGLWHGTGWTFIAWGCLHGFYLIFYQVTDPIWQNLARRIGFDRHLRLTGFLQQTTTFILVILSFIIFRADSLSDAHYILTHLFYGMPTYVTQSFHMVIAMFVSPSSAALDSTVRYLLSPLYLDTSFNSMLILFSFMVFILIEWTRFDLAKLDSRPAPARWVVYGLFLIISLLFSVQSAINNEFIYFQF